MQRSFIFLLLAFICGVLGDVAITSPSAGASFSGSSGKVSVTVEWVDDDSQGDYSLSNVDWFSFVLCTGPDKDIDGFYTIATKQTLKSNSYDATFSSSITGDGYYFIQVYAMFKDGSTTMHYTSRFHLTGMTGSTATLSAAPTETGTGPGPNTNYANGGTSSINSASFSVTYTKQTGSVRYAPMQTQPGSSISYTTWSLRHATSAYTPYTSASPSPNVDTTITAGWSYTVTSTYNWAPTQSSPTGWYEPGSKVTQASLSSAAKKKRWID